MERLTKKHDGSGSYTQFGDKYIPNHNIRHKQCVEKLGKLEDIEEELRIPLEVLFKALKDGAYTKFDGQIWKCTSIDIFYSDYFEKYLLEAYYIENVETFDSSYEHPLNIEDYRKTWALTREELE